MNFFDIIDTMSIDEMRARLADYMAKDEQYAAHPIAVEVRLSGTNCTRCRYEVLLIDEEGNEIPVLFHDRYSRLVYIYTLMHPKGYQRRSLNKPEKDFSELACLYRAVFMADPDRLIAYAAKDFDHMMSMAVSFIRKVLKKMIGCEVLTIGNSRHYNGRTVIPAVHDGLEVIIDSQLQSHI